MSDKDLKVSYNFESTPLLFKFSGWLSRIGVISSLKKGSWLDIMCGEVCQLQTFEINNKKISEFYAIDQKISKSVSKRINTKNFRINDSLPYEDNFFENVTLINGLEHLVRPQEILNECFRILKPKGVLQVIVPTWFGKPILEFLAFKIKIGGQITDGIDDHKMYYDEKTLWPMLIKSGFKPSRIKLKRIKLFCSLLAVAEK